MLNWLASLPGAVAQGIIWGIMAIGVYITFRILDIADLSVDGTLCTGGAVCAVLITAGVPVPVALLAALLSGLLAGLLTGVFHTFLGIPAILSGILTQLILWSINLKIMGKANVPLSARAFPVWLTSMNIPRSLPVLLAFCVAIILLLYWLFGTELGASIRATGCNLNMSRAQGINTNFTKILGLMFSNALVALAGALLTQYQGFADINMGRGAIVIGLAAIVIGEATVTRFFTNFIARLSGVILGGVIYFFVYQTVIFIGLDPDLLKMLSAIVVAVFLGIPYLKKQYFPAGKRKGENHA